MWPYSSPLRPPRKKLHVSVRYRAEGDGHWHVGETENISRTGLLFRADAPLPLEGAVEIVLVLPGRLIDTTTAELVCAGTVKRLINVREIEGQRAVGVEFRSIAGETLEALLSRI